MPKKMPEKIQIQCTINQVPQKLNAHPMTRLLDVLRENGLTGSKEGCGEGECGACSILINNELVNSCLVPAIQAEGCEILTIEGIDYGKLQESFIKKGGAQCGFCTPGMIMASYALLLKNPKPSAEEIRTALAGNLCRCTGYQKIVEAVASV